MNFRIFNAVLLLLIASAEGFDLKCTPVTSPLIFLGTIYHCRVATLTVSSPDDTITSVNGATTPTTFQGLSFYETKFSNVPNGIAKFFPDLRELNLYSNGLKSIEAADLKDLAALESLIVQSNLITQLPSDLFKFTPNLKHLYFYGNQIAFVGKDLLTNLKSPARFNFQFNKCIDSQTTSDFEAFKATLRSKCPEPPIKDYSEDFAKCKKEVADLKSENEKLKLNEKSSSENAKSKDKEISSLKAENEKKELDKKSLLEDVKLKDGRISDLKAEIEELKNNCYNGLLDSSTKLLHEESRKLKKCKVETKETLAEIIVNVLNTTETEISLGIAVASPETKITKIQDASGNEVTPNQTELVIYQQNTLFLPTNLGQFFPSTRRLSVTFSGLYRLDARSFQNMKQLKAVNFTGNKLVEITETAFSELTSLKDLDLSNNNIEVISADAFKSNVNLEIVRLDNNNLEIIDGQLFSSNKMLQKLFLNQNRLKYINANLLMSLDALEVVDFSGNSCINLSHPNSTLREIATAIADSCIAPVKVTCKDEIVDLQIDESNCEVEELTLDQPGAKLLLNELDSEKKIEKFSVISQKMLFMPIQLSETFPSLVQLYVEQSQLTTLQKTDFEGLVLLQELTIEWNNISRIDEGVFDAIPQITYLSLAYNQIQSLPPKAFAKLMKMEVLILKGNQLKKFTFTLLPLKGNAIKDLQLQENQLEFIDSKFLSRLGNAEVIDLTDNECISVKYQKPDPAERKIIELKGLIAHKCSDDSDED